jgi:hypothetical protein
MQYYESFLQYVQPKMPKNYPKVFPNSRMFVLTSLREYKAFFNDQYNLHTDFLEYLVAIYYFSLHAL